MKKRNRLRRAVVFWLASVFSMTVLLAVSFSVYLELNREVKQMKQMAVLWEQQHQNSANESTVILANTETESKGTKETEQPRDLSMKSIEDDVTPKQPQEDGEEPTAPPEEVITEPETGEFQSKEEEVTLLFAGDLLISGAIVRQYEKYDSQISGLTEASLLEAMNEADIFMVNQEFPFSDRGEAMEDKEYTFRASMDKTKILGELGIDIVSLANNHTLDYGIDALMDTFTALDDAGVAYVGAGENLDRAKALQIIEVEDKKIGFLAASRVIPVTNWNATASRAGMLTTYNPEKLLMEIEAAESECDFLVVYVHWGIEYQESPEDYQITMAKQYIDAGADAVIGSHTHVVQGISYYNGKLIAYNLGNFIFGNTIKQGMMLKLTLDENNDVTAQIVPFYSPGFMLKEMTEEKKQEFYDYIAQISYGVDVDEKGIILPLQ